MPDIEKFADDWPDSADSGDAGDPAPSRSTYSEPALSQWRESLVNEFLVPHMGSEVTALEVGPGLGEWTERVLGTVQTLIVADRRAETLTGIRERLGPRPDLHAVPIVAHRLGEVPDASVDLAYSLDFFPQVDGSMLDVWLGELSRVLRPNGHLVVHHAASPRRLRAVASPTSGRHNRGTSRSGRASHGAANRSASIGSAASFTTNGLVTTRQTSSWGPAGEFSVNKFRDVITVARKPTGAITSRPG